MFGLTPRERQVLALLAEGATNRQIGNALYMAEKTASVHVSRILSKLGVRTRTQAAAVAHRQHLDYEGVGAAGMRAGDQLTAIPPPLSRAAGCAAAPAARARCNSCSAGSQASRAVR